MSLYPVRPIGRVVSALTDLSAAPKQGFEGGPDAWVEFEPELADGFRDLKPGDQVYLLTWLEKARRDILVVHPRDDPAAPETGVFSTRSADRPNPIGLHPVEVLAVGENRFQVRHLEAVDGTPVLDVKPVINRSEA